MANEELVAEQQNSVEETQENVENAEIDALLDSVEKPADEDFLAGFYEMHLKVVRGLIEPLGKNALKRVLLNVLMGEFADKAYTPRTEAERKIAYHFNEAVEKRHILRFEREVEVAQKALAQEKADLEKIEEMNKLSQEAQKLLEDAQKEDGITVKE